jgi:murein DD-endopeptidase MepM/ murein hydrolase activator NlpD
MLDARLALASLHILALAMGLGGAWSRARAVHNSADANALRRAFIGDLWLGLAILVWLTTGLWWLLSGTDARVDYYATDSSFYVKMALFVSVVALEFWPTRTLLRWRFSRSEPSARDAGRIEALSYVQCALLVATVVAATASASRVVGAPTSHTRAVRASEPVVQGVASGEVARVEPSGSETVTNSDLALLTHEIAMPLRGINPDSLRSSFNAPRAGGLRKHEALDIMAPRFTPIFSAVKGRVLKLFTSVAGGLMIYAADSTERFIVLYAHLDHYASGLRDGEPLERGQLIGYVGSTGNASANAPHLHFGILRSADVKRWSKGTAIDPLPVLRAAASLDESSR